METEKNKENVKSKSKLGSATIFLLIGIVLGYVGFSLENEYGGISEGKNLVVTGQCRVIPSGSINLTNDQVKIISKNDQSFKGIFLKGSVYVSCERKSIVTSNAVVSSLSGETSLVVTSETQKTIIKDEVEGLDQKSVLITGECLLEGKKQILSSRVLDITSVYSQEGTLSIRGILPATSQVAVCQKGNFKYREIRGDYDKFLEKEKELLFPKAVVLPVEDKSLVGKTVRVWGTCTEVETKKSRDYFKKPVYVTNEISNDQGVYLIYASTIDKKGFALNIKCNKKDNPNTYWSVSEDNQAFAFEGNTELDTVKISGHCSVEGEDKTRLFSENDLKVVNVTRGKDKITSVSGYLKIEGKIVQVTCNSQDNNGVVIKEASNN